MRNPFSKKTQSQTPSASPDEQRKGSMPTSNAEQAATSKGKWRRTVAQRLLAARSRYQGEDLDQQSSIIPQHVQIPSLKYDSRNDRPAFDSNWFPTPQGYYYSDPGSYIKRRTVLMGYGGQYQELPHTKYFSEVPSPPLHQYGSPAPGSTSEQHIHGSQRRVVAMNFGQQHQLAPQPYPQQQQQYYQDLGLTPIENIVHPPTSPSPFRPYNQPLHTFSIPTQGPSFQIFTPAPNLHSTTNDEIELEGTEWENEGNGLLARTSEKRVNAENGKNKEVMENDRDDLLRSHSTTETPSLSQKAFASIVAEEEASSSASDELGVSTFRHQEVLSLTTIVPSVSPQISTTVISVTQTRIYQKLHQADSFRVLKILPGETGSAIQCELNTFQLHNSPPRYEAISYAWGTSKDRREIFCNDQSLRVTDNLHDALERLRSQNHGQTRLVWVDAICIDQSNDQERGHQVRLMRDVYRIASAVIIWLGKDSNDDAISAFSVVCAVVNRHYELKGLSSEARLDCPRADYANLPWQSGTPPISSPLWHSVARLYDCDWNWRLWCVQEVAVATNAIAVWGDAVIPWKWIGLAAARIRTNNWDVLMHYNLTGVYNSYLVYRISPHATDLPRLSLSFSLLLGLTRQFEATRPEDRIFGILGLPTTDSDPKSGELFTSPDYTIPHTEVYKRIALKVLEQEQNLDILSSVQHGEELDCSSPSWVPQWDKAFTQNIGTPKRGVAFNACLEFELRSGLVYQAQSLRHEEDADPKRGDPHGFLRLEGFQIDKVLSVVTQTGSSANVLEQYPTTFFRDQIESDEERLLLTLMTGKDWYGLKIEDCFQSLDDFRAALRKYRPLVEPSLSSISTGNVDRFMQAALNACRGRRIFGTAQFPLGLGPAAMRKGDVLCVLFGGQVPFILRLEGDHYRLVGECYVYELMEGRGLLERGLPMTCFDIY